MPRKTHPQRDQRGPSGRASMRPRPDAAENGFRPAHRLRRPSASMRPRPDAAENTQVIQRATEWRALQ